MALTAADLDAQDPLAKCAAEFYKTPGQIYLDGNSLGLLCKPAEASLNQAIEAWRARAIQGWTEGPEPWFEMSRKVSALLAPILGAKPPDVMVGESTTVNLHQLLATFHRLGDRILIDEWSFPSDRYAIESRLRRSGQNPESDLVIVPDRDGVIDEVALIRAMDDRVRFAVLPSVVYRSGRLLDMATITKRARERDVVIAWDCSHSAGVIPHQFREDSISLAFGCTYKYLNGGPGSPGWLYVHPGLRDRQPGLAGWFGSDPMRQFEMSDWLQPANDAGRYMIGTPHVLSLAPLLGSLELINRAGVPALREKSLDLTQYFWQEGTLRLRGTDDSLQVVTSRDGSQRGGHVTYSHPHAGPLSRDLRRHGVIVDHRPPDLVRLAPSPLYTSYLECSVALDLFDAVLSNRSYLNLEDDHALVT